MLLADARLAIDGGRPVRTEPLPRWPSYSAEEIEAVAAVLRSGNVNYWTGEHGRRFEQEFAASAGCRYGVAVCSGSVALEIALSALGIGAGDDVIVPARTFVASGMCVVRCGARPVFADVDRDTQTITAETASAVLTPRTRAMVAVHLAGHPCDMDPLLALANRHGIHVIEDCAQAHGATYRGRPVGSMGRLAAFSFCNDKIMSTGGEGGMVTGNDEALWRRAWSLKDNGKSHDAVLACQQSPGFKWLHESIGTNWRMTEMQAALGRVQLQRLAGFVAARRRNVALLTRQLDDLPALRLVPPPPEFGHSYYRYYAFVRPEELCAGWTRDRIMQAILAEGVPCLSGSCSEIYLEKAFPEAWRPAERLPVARELGETSLCFLVHPALREEDMLDTCHAIEKVMLVATRRRALAAGA